MMLQALLVSKDDQAAETLIHVSAQLGVAIVRSSAADGAFARLTDEPFDQIIVDFEDAETASRILESSRQLAGHDHHPPLTVALLPDRQQIRSILGSGAHFVIVKPVVSEQALATLSAAAAILTRERRQAPRVAVQVPVTIVNQENTIEGILLDLSLGGMDVLAAKQIPSSAKVRALFELPDSLRIEVDAEVAWSTANCQIGLRFLDLSPNVREQLGEWLKSRAHDVLPDDTAEAHPCKLTDLSLGGCYVETESPFPQSSAVDLCLKAAGIELHTEGLVRIMHPGHGMGIEFPSRTEEQRKSVAELIECLSGHPEALPELEISPRSLIASPADLTPGGNAEATTEDPLLELLRTGSPLEQEAFLAELRGQRTADVGDSNA